MMDGALLYSKGNMCPENDIFNIREIIMEGAEYEELNNELVKFVYSRVELHEPFDNILDRFADHVFERMKNEGFSFETHGGNSWIYVVKCDCEHCEHRGEGMDFGFPRCKINSYSGDHKGVKYCVYMAEKMRAEQ